MLKIIYIYLIIILIMFILHLLILQMRQEGKIFQAQFKAKLKNMISSYPSESIHFRELVNLLSHHNILLQSKAQILKLSKLFDNPLKLCRIQVPLSYLQLNSIRSSSTKSYYVVKVQSFKVHRQFSESISSNHQKSFCLEFLVKRMKKHFGSQNNWFRQLGGSSISITIDFYTFKKNLSKILINSSHEHCLNQIIKSFLKDGNKNQIHFQQFTKVVKQLLQKKDKSLGKSTKNPYLTQFFLQTPKSLAPGIDLTITRSSLERKSIEMMTTSSKFRRRKSIRTQRDEKEGDQLDKNFLIFAQKCFMHNKKSFGSISVPSPSDQYSRKTKSFFSKRIKTGEKSNRQQVHTTLENKPKTFSENFNIQLSSKKQLVIQTNQSKMDDYVVVIENQSGLQIEI